MFIDIAKLKSKSNKDYTNIYWDGVYDKLIYMRICPMMMIAIEWLNGVLRVHSFEKSSRYRWDCICSNIVAGKQLVRSCFLVSLIDWPAERIKDLEILQVLQGN